MTIANVGIGTALSSQTYVDMCAAYSCTPGTDITTALQTAINAANSANQDTTLFFSKPGTYNINGATQSGSGTVGGQAYTYSGQIVFPARAFSQGPISITIAGPHPIPNFFYGGTGFLQATGGTVLVSNLATSGASVFDAIPGDAPLGVAMTAITVVFQDCIVRAPSNPVCNGVDGIHAVSMEFRGETRVDTSATAFVNLTGTGFGVRFPPYQNGALSRIAGSFEVQGFPTGLVTSEHFTADLVLCSVCTTGWSPGGNGIGHSQYIGRLVLQGCFDGIKPTAGAQAKIGVLDIGDVVPYDINTILNDPNNSLCGEATVYPHNQGVPEGFPVIGGANFRLRPFNTQAPQWPRDTMTVLSTGLLQTTNFLGVTDATHDRYLPYRNTSGTGLFLRTTETDWTKNGTTLKSNGAFNWPFAFMRLYLGRAGASRVWRTIVTTNNGAFTIYIPIGLVISGGNALNFLYVCLLSSILNGSTNTVSLNSQIQATGVNTVLVQSAANAVAANTKYIVDTIVSNPPGGPYAVTVKVGTTLANLATVLTTVEGGTGPLATGTYTLASAEYAQMTDTEQYETRDGVGVFSDTGSAFTFCGVLPN